MGRAKHGLLEKFSCLSDAVREVHEWTTEDWGAAKQGVEYTTSLVKDCADTIYEEGAAAEELSGEAAELLLDLGARQAEERRTEKDFLATGSFRRACGTIGGLVEKVTLGEQLTAAYEAQDIGYKVNEHLVCGNEENLSIVIDETCLHWDALID